ncbi:hypothetical protein PR048_002126 [Dryococelus australis]|uniref:Integrase zinc-binding domain-containing protein n=1 Tax=Dryococelus australis TaxID=614101 RepID=A0ABQ9IKF2_9NEOP|nr:hypothetical protein PR048_002126 [Dryococelus australis]
MILISKDLCVDICRHFHDHPNAGHPETRETLIVMSTRYIWDGMSWDVYQYIADGQTTKAMHAMDSNICQSNGTLSPQYQGKQIPVSLEDIFPQWVTAFPLPSQESHHIIRKFKQCSFPMLGIPAEHFDRERHPVKKWLLACQEWGAETWTTPPYYLQANPTE